MSSPTTPVELLDLKMLPAWANEPARANDYSSFEGEDSRATERQDRGPQRGRERPRRPPQSRDSKDRRARPEGRGRPDRRESDRPQENHPEREAVPLPTVSVRFLPRPPAFESVVAQIKSGPVAYSVFALARLFLEKPERYDVRVSAAEGSELYQLGEDGPVAADRKILENAAFPSVKDDFYKIEVVQTEPVKGNFTNVARCRLSGTLLGPTNHHGYQPALRNLFEQRFSRRMSFADYQRQIEIVSDPAVVEQWKEQARSVTTYVTKSGEPPLTFNTAAEAERHFRQDHLPTLLRSARDLKIGGVLSRRLPDRSLGRVIENAWAHETRSPSQMMQELSAGLRQAGLHILRHRRGMLFVLPIRARVFGHERAGVSASINAILEKVTATPGINRKLLAEQLAPSIGEPADLERAKITLASDLRWLISEGYLIEFNDGSLDLPRAKVASPTSSPSQGKPDEASSVNAPETFAPESSGPAAEESIGMSVEQNVEPMESSNETVSETTADAAAPAATVSPESVARP